MVIKMELYILETTVAIIFAIIITIFFKVRKIKKSWNQFSNINDSLNNSTWNNIYIRKTYY